MKPFVVNRHGRLVFPAVARRGFALEDRGAERRLAPRKLHALAGVRVPLAKGTQRPSALRAAVFRLRGRASADRAFPALALGVAIITVANVSREGRSAPGASPGPPEGRACEARGAGRRTPLRHGLPPEAPSNERGYRNICLGISSCEAARAADASPICGQAANYPQARSARPSAPTRTAAREPASG